MHASPRGLVMASATFLALVFALFLSFLLAVALLVRMPLVGGPEGGDQQEGRKTQRSKDQYGASAGDPSFRCVEDLPVSAEVLGDPDRG